MKKIRYEEMLPAEFLDAMDRMPVCIVPLGLLEWHADHLPLGLDGLKAHGICLRIAEKLDGGVVLPPVYFGRPGFSTYTGTLTFSEALVNLLLSELCQQLKKIGAKVIVFMVGHYGPLQEDCIARAAMILARENPDIRIIAHRECDGVEIDGEMPCDHAGKWETSMFMSMYPELRIWNFCAIRHCRRSVTSMRQTIIIVKARSGSGKPTYMLPPQSWAGGR